MKYKSVYGDGGVMWWGFGWNYTQSNLAIFGHSVKSAHRQCG
jgi:hypothetical protein